MNPIAKGFMVALLLGLGGCVTLFPKVTPSQLYRFDGRLSEVAATNPAPSRVGVVRTGGSFNAAAAGDRILTVTGSQVAYLAKSRWAEPAEVLFNEALLRAFNAGPGPARLVIRGEPARADYTLRLDVQRFEAVYDRGARAAPEVCLEIHMVLSRTSNPAQIKDETLAVKARASDNRVSAIVRAFDQAVGKAVAAIIAKTNSGITAT
ncbi:MAG: ABC transporter [Phenylobacterium zucineum]|nr:MAG: ABC transporter [Phenylobacterium zucineum]